jgi:hypothetical protein
MAIEACARVEMGEQHTGILLATTAMGAIETLQGSEYGLQTRVVCWDALKKAGSPQADEKLFGNIRDPGFQRSFMKRQMVADVA